MIEILTENLGAGELKTFVMQGEYVELLEAQYPLDVFMMDRSGGQISTMRQAEASFFSRPGKFEVIQLQSAQAQRVRLFVGSGDAGTRRTAGVVQIVDGEKSRTLAGGMYAGAPFCGAVAATYSNIQLWNPAASGKNLIVAAMSYGTTTDGSINVLMSATQLANAFGTAPGNKKAGGPAPVGLLRNENKAAPDPFALGTLRNEATKANSPQQWQVKGALVVPPGYGLNVYSPTANITTTANFEWFEEII